MITMQSILAGILVIALLYCAVKHIVELTIYPRKRKYKKGTQTAQIPNEKATPAQAAFIYFYDKNILHTEIMGNVIIAMLFNLTRKGFLTIEKLQNRIQISLLDNPLLDKLNEEERILYDILAKQKDPGTNQISLDQLANYMRKYPKEFGKSMNAIAIKAKVQAEQEGKYKEKEVRNAEKYVWLAIIYTAAGFISLWFTNLIILMAIFNGLLCSLIAYRLHNLTLKGMDEKNNWIALQEYLKDLPHKDVRTIPSLAELEAHYIYMITFGKEEIIETWKKVYPEVLELKEGETYTYMPNLYADTYFMKEIQQQIIEAYEEVYKQNKAIAPKIFK